jgi:hypothetical protein
MKKRKLRVWLEYPFANTPIEEEIIELQPEEDADEIGQIMLSTMYENNVPGGWEVIEVDEEEV